MLLRDQVVLVTGAGRGVGRAIAVAFAREGARVAVTGRTSQTREAVAAEIGAAGGQAIALPLDVTLDSQVQAAVDRVLEAWGCVDILVNNAGVITYNTPVWSTTVQQWDAVMAVNLRGVFLCCNAVAHHMVERGSGIIINVASSSGRTADDDYGAYAASKWGVVGYTASLGRSLRHHGVRVNGINPGWVDTDMARAEVPQGDPDWTTPNEVAQAAIFLAAHAPRDMTGQCIDLFGS